MLWDTSEDADGDAGGVVDVETLATGVVVMEVDTEGVVASRPTASMVKVTVVDHVLVPIVRGPDVPGAKVIPTLLKKIEDEGMSNCPSGNRTPTEDKVVK